MFGSCISRDNFNSRFNADYRTWFDVSALSFQSSVIAMMSPPVEPDFPPVEDPAQYALKITRQDMTREFLGDLAAAQPDYLVLDFFADIHFGALRLADGRYLTNNRWMLWPTDVWTRLKASGDATPLRIFDDPDAYIALWTEAMDRFAAYVAEHCPSTRVIVHHGFNTNDVAVPGQARPVKLRQFRNAAPLNVPLANKLWARLDEHAATAYGWDSIDLRAEHYTTYADHPWKAFYVHYNPDYYHRFLGEMHLRVLADEIPPEALDRVERIAEAGHEHAVREAGFWKAQVTEQERRIRELESLGIVGAVKFALGQRIRETRGRREKRRSKKPREKES